MLRLWIYLYNDIHNLSWEHVKKIEINLIIKNLELDFLSNSFGLMNSKLFKMKLF
jgi:hypothetical protein